MMSNEVQISGTIIIKSKYPNQNLFGYKDMISTSNKHVENEEVNDIADKIMLRVRETYNSPKNHPKYQLSHGYLSQQLTSSRLQQESPIIKKEQPVVSPIIIKEQQIVHPITLDIPELEKPNLQKQLSVPDLFNNFQSWKKLGTPAKTKNSTSISTTPSNFRPIQQQYQKMINQNKNTVKKIAPASAQTKKSINLVQAKSMQVQSVRKQNIITENKQIKLQELPCSISLSERSQDGQGIQLLDSLNSYLRKNSQIVNNGKKTSPPRKIQPIQKTTQIKRDNKQIQSQSTKDFHKVQSPTSVSQKMKPQPSLKLLKPLIVDKQFCSDEFTKALLDQLRSVKLIKDQYINKLNIK